MMWLLAEFSSMKALGRRPPLFPWSPKVDLASLGPLSMRGKECALRSEDKIFNLISQVTTHHFYCILFAWSDSQVQLISQERGITEGHEYQEVGFMEAICFKRFNIIFSQYFEDILSLSSSICFQTRWLMLIWILFLCR